jgi:hypothetical protein
VVYADTSTGTGTVVGQKMSNSNLNDSTHHYSLSTIFHAVGPGKQFPPVAHFRGKPEALAQSQRRDVDEETTEEQLPNSEVLKSSTPLPLLQQTKTAAPWKVYDAADSLLMDRRKTVKTNTGSKASKMIYSSHFENVQAIHNHISVDDNKVGIVHQTFRMAAMAVLEAIQKSPLDVTKKPNNDTWKHDLPEVLLSNYGTKIPRTTLPGLRAYCMERSYENKEYTKRKGGKTEIISRPAKMLKMKSQKDVTQQLPTTPGTIETKSSTHIKRVDEKLESQLNITKDSDNKLTDTPDTASSYTIQSRNAKSRPTSTVHTTHAILRTAGDILLDQLYPKFGNTTETTIPIESLTSKTITKNDVLHTAQKFAHRSIAAIEHATRRNKLRYHYRTENAFFDYMDSIVSLVHDHPYLYQKHNLLLDGHIENDSLQKIEYQPNNESITYEWEMECRPRLLSILGSGTGHAIYIDVQWSTRHGRIADTLRTMIHPSTTTTKTTTIYDSCDENFGPHLIITTENDAFRFGKEFYKYNRHSRFFNNDTNENNQLYSLTYGGSKVQRRNLRKLFTHANGTRSASFHVLITSYDTFLEDLLHFCQIPFDTVVLDDGVAWMASREQNSTLGLIWHSALFSTNDQYNGLAGTTFKEWDYTKDDFTETLTKEAWIGLTARHRIATGSTFACSNDQSTQLIPVSNLLEFLLPQFFTDIKEEWDKSKIWNDMISMDYYRKLLSRLIVVYSDNSSAQDMLCLAQNALVGKLLSSDRSNDPPVPLVYTDDDFISGGKALLRPMIRWLGLPQTSWLRYALGKANLQHILDSMKVSTFFGPFCEQTTTSSSLTSAGATGQISGAAAFRLAVRCGRHFGSELGLRQHLSAQHAPFGTWLCRTCSADCVTSQARTYHEKSCGQTRKGRLYAKLLYGSGI